MTGEVVAIIPARGGSKAVPRKNLAPVGGIPLVARAVRAARESGAIDRVVVSTDDAEIAGVARGWGAEIVWRPAELAGDTAGSESAVLHALDELEASGHEARTVAFLQATSPFIPPRALADAVQRVEAGGADSAFSARESYAFFWADGPGGATAVGHDRDVRPRRQDRDPLFIETGAFYVFDAAGFRRARHRFFGRTEIVPVPERLAVEIDTTEELHLARLLADGEDGAIDAAAVVTDFDGVHTDDTAIVGEDGSERVRVSRSDGMGVALLRRAGVPVLILSTETNPVVSARATKLGVDVIQASRDKAAALAAWAAEHEVPLSRIAYVGNDVNDLGALESVGWPIAVAGSHPLVLAAARVVLTRSGGAGAVREVADRVLAARRDALAPQKGDRT
ncbi:acylneuraminate cytidylyltransferase [Microbacterium sp. ZXX196]|uniref:acylneuraminate cytidylyltransferase n=1 Tax=Microbacterium sp. ZXX196 TaxID=2609291 RepID=UPI0012BA0BD6|nr:acylneuraminate cytidylyltransferase [Microbacterium sp. ZXX196]MTE23784.1 NTP transferase domain-containing protein [Microbacterium sp. ZXX196]